MTYLHYKLDQITLQITSKLKYNIKIIFARKVQNTQWLVNILRGILKKPKTIKTDSVII